MHLTRTLVAALAVAAIASPAAVAAPADWAQPAPEPKQDLRMPDRRDDPTAPASRPETTGNPNVSTPAKDYSMNAAGGDYAPATTTVATSAPAPAPAGDSGGIETLPFVLSLCGALILGLGAGTALSGRRTAGLAS